MSADRSSDYHRIAKRFSGSEIQEDATVKTPPHTTGRCKLWRSRFSPEPKKKAKPLAAAVHARRRGWRRRKRNVALPHRAVVELDAQAIRRECRALVKGFGIDVARIVDPSARRLAGLI